MSKAPAGLEAFTRLKERVLLERRICGEYILEAREVPAGVEGEAGLERFLRDYAVRFGFSGPDVGEAEWRCAEVFREEAKRHLIDTLIGGTKTGHSRWDVQPIDAERFAEDFIALFADDGRFFCGVEPAGEGQGLAPYQRPGFWEYVFSGGCIAVDGRIVGAFWVLDCD